MKKAVARMVRMEDLLARIGSTDPTAKTWTCPRCGVIPAKEVRQRPGYYVRQGCRCPVPLDETPTERQERQRRQREQIYTWIGRAWADLVLLQKTFATFESSRQPAAFAQAQAFVAHPQGTLALFGGYGVGKTHLLAAIANAFVEREQVCLYVSAMTLFDVVQERIQHNQGYYDLLKRAFHVPLLLLDDLDKPRPGDFREAIYYQLIEKRTLAGLPLVISCNVPPPQLVRWIGEAARSRLLMDLHPVAMDGPDYRLAARRT